MVIQKIDNKPKSKFRLAIIIGLITVVLFIISGEIYVRNSGELNKMAPQILKEKSIEYEPSVFARHIFPLKEQKLIDYAWARGPRGVPSRYINRLGYRGPLFNEKKDPEKIRIIVYGGSAVFDLGLSEGEDWPRKIERNLHKLGFKNVEVINAGIPGHSSFDSFGRLYAEGHLLEPDFVILYNTWNDIKRFGSDKSLLREIKPHEPTSNPMLFAQNGLDQFLIKHSFLYIALRQTYLQRKLSVGPEGSTITELSYKTLNPKALDQFKLSIELFVDAARNTGTVPILMTQGRLINAANKNNAPQRLGYALKVMPIEFMYLAFEEADRIIRRVAQEKNVKLIDGSRLLIEDQHAIYFDHIHLTYYGSDLIAKIVSENLRDLLNDEKKSIIETN